MMIKRKNRRWERIAKINPAGMMVTGGCFKIHKRYDLRLEFVLYLEKYKQIPAVSQVNLRFCNNLRVSSDFSDTVQLLAQKNNFM